MRTSRALTPPGTRTDDVRTSRVPELGLPLLRGHDRVAVGRERGAVDGLRRRELLDQRPRVGVEDPRTCVAGGQDRLAVGAVARAVRLRVACPEDAPLARREQRRAESGLDEREPGIEGGCLDRELEAGLRARTGARSATGRPTRWNARPVRSRAPLPWPSWPSSRSSSRASTRAARGCSHASAATRACCAFLSSLVASVLLLHRVYFSLALRRRSSRLSALSASVLAVAVSLFALLRGHHCHQSWRVLRSSFTCAPASERRSRCS